MGLPTSYSTNTILKTYLDSDWNVLAIRVQRQQIDFSGILDLDPNALPTAPIALTFSGTQPVLPVTITPDNNSDSVATLVWILGNQQYSPQNSAALTIDFSQMGGYKNLVADIGLPDDTPYRSSTDYPADYLRLRQQTLQSYQNHAYVVEMAQPIDYELFIDQQLPDPVWSRVVEGKRYLTRLYTLWYPPSVDMDERFIPDPDKPDVADEVNLNDYVDPFDYWGCSSRDLISTETEANLPLEHRYISELKADIAYPIGWQMTVLTGRDMPISDKQHYSVYDLWVFAPRSISQSDFDNFAKGGNQLPMLVLAQVSTSSCTYPPAKDDILLHALDVSALPATAQWQAFIRYDPVLNAAHNDDFDGIFATLIASPDNWNKHRASYEAMLNYAVGYQYFTDPQLRHTLFLGSATDVMQIPFPADWSEYFQDGEHIIAPAGSTDLSAEPYISLYPAPFDRDAEVLSSIISDYNLDAATTYDDLAQMTAFRANGRAGYILVKHLTYRWMGASDRLLVEVSAPAQIYADNETLLTQISKSIIQAQNPLVCLI